MTIILKSYGQNLDYELNSWQHLNDDKPTKYVKRTLSSIGQADMYVHKTYLCKGGGSAYGGKWQPKKESDKKFLGEPNSTRKMHIDGKKGGYDAEMKYDEDGKLYVERHYTDHFNPTHHSNPHDHMYNWEDGFPQREGTINYFDGDVPDFDKGWYSQIMSQQMVSKSDDVLVIPYRPEENKFETLGEFKRYIDAGWELLFEYRNTEYGIEKSYENDTYILWVCGKDKQITGLTLEQVLNYEIDAFLNLLLFINSLLVISESNYIDNEIKTLAKKIWKD